MDIAGTLLDVAEDMERHMDADGVGCFIWTKGCYARNAKGDKVDFFAEDASAWNVFGHIKRREIDSIVVRDCFSAALAYGMDADMWSWLNAFEETGKPVGEAALAAFGFARAVESAARGHGGGFVRLRDCDWLHWAMNMVNDAEERKAREIVDWCRRSADLYPGRAAALGEPLPGSWLVGAKEAEEEYAAEGYYPPLVRIAKERA